MLDEKQGFRPIATGRLFPHYTWVDGPNAHYPAHAHPTETAHSILTGEMTLTMNGESRIFRAGERCDVPAGASHSAQMGRLGCRYLTGERT